MRTATYLINRSPTNTDDKTPAKNWLGNKLNIKNLQIFGCNYCKKLEYVRKLDKRSKKYTMTGYFTKRNCLWDKNGRKVEEINARDVIFDDSYQTEEKSKNKCTENAIIRTENEEKDENAALEETTNIQ